MKWMRKIRFPRQNKDLFHNGYGRDFALQRIPASIATSYCSVEAATIVLLREKKIVIPHTWDTYLRFVRRASCFMNGTEKIRELFFQICWTPTALTLCVLFPNLFRRDNGTYNTILTLLTDNSMVEIAYFHTIVFSRGRSWTILMICVQYR